LCKRGFDITCAVAALVLLGPLLVLLALLVKLSDRGPALYGHTRIGRSGSPFLCLKFRTMAENGDDILRAHFARYPQCRDEWLATRKLQNDPRVTRVGFVLRKLSLDELPQLLNILRGEMSFVGPRPLVLEDDRRVVGWHRQRLDITPGMTGHWQVLGSSRVPLHEMVAIDYLYVANWSLWTDLKYLLRTVPHVLGGRGL
jgi:exopolysaccharide production protein ExoY